jgi:hypothetical protein
VAGPAGWGAGLERTGLRPTETKLRQRVGGRRQTLKTWPLTARGPKKERRMNFLFIFRKHFREKTK